MKTLFGITTFGSFAYVELSIFCHRQWGADVIVCDDGSCSEKLHEVCSKYNVPLIGVCRTREKVPGFGDLIATTELIRYAAAHGFDLAVKQSRRWICLADPRPSLEDLASRSGGNTFSHITKSFNFGFRTEFTGYLVKDWLPILPEIYKQIKSGREVFVEGYIHNLARKIEPDSVQYRDFIAGEAGFQPDQTGYVHWDFMGDDRRAVPEHILWHDSHNAADYYHKAQELGLDSSLTDFKDFNK